MVTFDVVRRRLVTDVIMMMEVNAIRTKSEMASNL
jgi:hypothetical protein